MSIHAASFFVLLVCCEGRISSSLFELSPMHPETHSSHSIGGLRTSRTSVVPPVFGLSEIISKSRKSVVQILTTSTSFDWGRPWETVSNIQSSGSGFFVEIKGRGFIVTNAHVVKEAVGLLVALPAYGKERFQAEVYSVCHEKDIALLVFRNVSKNALIQLGAVILPLQVGDSNTFDQGSVALAIGYPLGLPNIKATTGILAGTEHVDGRFYLQITSPINPGNSGGPLLDTAGRVVGINSAAIESASNVGYSIPSAHFLPLITSMVVDDNAENVKGRSVGALWAERLATSRRGGVRVQRFPMLGAELSAATLQLGLEQGYRGNGGVYVAEVYSYGFFHSVGLQHGDLLLSFHGQALDRFGEAQGPADSRLNVYDLSERLMLGSVVVLTAWRNGTTRTLTGPFVCLPYPRIHHVYEPVVQGVQYEAFGGLVLMDLTLNHVQRLSQQNENLLPFSSGHELLTQPRVVISDILSESTLIPASTLAVGDLLDRINGVRVRSLADYRAAFVPRGNSFSSTPYWTLQTGSGSLVVLNFREALALEKSLAALNHYSPSSLVTEQLRALQSNSSSSSWS